MIGRTLSHYQIVERIGAGGMGVVYRAHDLRLKRDVALKVLPPEALGDEASRRHMRREALTLSQLSHPNIGTIFDFDSQDGVDFLVMEYVNGPWLEDMIRAGPLAERDALVLGSQIADAIEAAHAKGVIHRDLKPANIGITSAGHVKVMDFGIARLLKPVVDETTTTETVHTSDVAGTLPYMAPEQLLGKEPDARVDLYAFGVVLYRTIVGRLPFDEKQATALADAILHSPPPPPAQGNPKISLRLQEIILRCLEKDPAFRYQTAADLKADLNRCRKQIETGGVSTYVGRTGSVAQKRVFKNNPLVLAGTALLILVLGIVFAISLRPRFPGILVPTSRQLTFIGSVVDPALSPDGKFFAYVDHTRAGRDRLMVQDIGEGRPLEVFAAEQCLNLRWAPDGSAVLCVALRDSLLRTFLIPHLGGPARMFPIVGRSLAWAPDGARFVAASRSGRRLIFTTVASNETTSTYLGAVPPPEDVDWSPREDLLVLQTVGPQEHQALWTMRPDGGRLRKIFEGDIAIKSPRWSSTGTAVYFLRENGSTMDLCKLPIRDRGKGSASRPVVVLAGMQTGASRGPLVSLTFSRDGRRMLYSRELVRSNLWSFRRRSSNRDSPVIGTQLTMGTSFDANPQISPDGRWVVFSKGSQAPQNLFVIPADGGDERQLTFSKAQNTCPVWSPDGTQIAFISNSSGAWRVWHMDTKGSGAQVFAHSQPAEAPNYVPIAWAPGSSIAYLAPGHDVSVLDPTTGGEHQLLPADSPADFLGLQWSPGGKRIAFLKLLDPARSSIFVLSRVDQSLVRIYEGGVIFPVGWSKDTEWIYGWDPQTSDRIVRFARGGSKPREYMPLPLKEEAVDSGLSISPDGSRVVASIVKTQTDAWLVESFDRDSK